MEAKELQPNSLRAKFGIDTIKNGLHCSENSEQSEIELEYFFPLNYADRRFKTTEQYENCSIAVIKPHANKEGKVGDIVTMICESGFRITAMKMICMDRMMCEEFYDVYKGIAPEYVQMVLQLASGPALAVEVTAKDPDINTHLAFRELCGPSDPVSIF